MARYRASALPFRAVIVPVILGIHVSLLAAILSQRGLTLEVEHVPLFVRMIPAVSQATLASSQIPVLKVRAPEIHVPVFAPIESPTAIDTESRHATPAPAPAAAQPVADSTSPAIEPPRFDLAYLDNPTPAYPALSRRVREEGRVLLRVRVDAAGKIESIELQATSGHPRLDEAAIEAVRRWRFQPARAGQRAIAGWAVVPISFQLSG